MEKDNFLYRQGGNSIDVVEFQGSTYVLHPAYCNMGKSYTVSELVGRDLGDEMKQHKDKFYHLRYHCKVGMQNNDCFQLIAKNVNNTVYVISRSMYSVQLTELRSTLRKGKVMFVNCFVKKNPLKYLISGLALSDTLPYCFATTFADGTVSLYDNPESSELTPVWKHQLEKDKRCAYQCDFGNHVYSLVVNNKSSVWHCDTRSESTRTLFNVKELRNFTSGDDILCKVVRSRSHHLYLVTANSVLLMDERYCKVPVMMWEHSLCSFPSFASMQTINGYEFLMFGNNADFKLCSLYQDLNTKQVNYSLSGLPNHFDFIQDTVRFAHHRNLWFDPWVSRLNDKMMGLASCVNPNDNSSLLLMSLNSTEDIFLQELRVCDDNAKEVKNDCVADYDVVGGRLLQEWEEKVVALTRGESHTSESIDDDDEPSTKSKCSGGGKDSERQALKPISVVDFYKSLEMSVHVKAECSPEGKKVWSLQNYVVNKFTPSSLDLVKSASHKEKGLAKYVPEGFSKYVDLKYLEDLNDQKSRSLLKLWQNKLKKKDEASPSFSYHRSPFQPKRLRVIPKNLKLPSTNDDWDSFSELAPESSVPKHSGSVSRTSKDPESSLRENTIWIYDEPQEDPLTSQNSDPNLPSANDQNHFSEAAVSIKSSPAPRHCGSVSPKVEELDLFPTENSDWLLHKQQKSPGSHSSRSENSDWLFHKPQKSSGSHSPTPENTDWLFHKPQNSPGSHSSRFENSDWLFHKPQKASGSRSLTPENTDLHFHKPQKSPGCHSSRSENFDWLFDQPQEASSSHVSTTENSDLLFHKEEASGSHSSTFENSDWLFHRPQKALGSFSSTPKNPDWRFDRPQKTSYNRLSTSENSDFLFQPPQKSEYNSERKKKRKLRDEFDML